MPDLRSDQGKWKVRRNGYGGYYVVDHAGRMAPRPFGFNILKHAEDRAAELNRLASDEEAR